MYTVYGEKAAMPPGHVAVRDTFPNVTSYSHVIQGAAGAVTIQPSGQILPVSANGNDYQRVLVLDVTSGQLVGALVCSSGGMVAWITQIPPASP